MRENQPYDQFAREILAVAGRVEDNPAVAWYHAVRDPTAQVEDMAQLFLGMQGLVRTICTSRVYSLSAGPNELNKGDRQNFSRYYPKRLSAEVLLDAIDTVTASKSRFAGVPVSTRATVGDQQVQRTACTAAVVVRADYLRNSTWTTRLTTTAGLSVILSAAKDLGTAGRFFAALRMTEWQPIPESRTVI